MNADFKHPKLTELAFCAGCAAKLRAEVLVDIINPFGKLFTQENYPNLLIGLEESDDAAIMKLNDQQALVFTTDFFPPLVDDPYDFGAIAATNSISDVYAMGGKPLMALNITAMPTDLPPETISEIFRGGAEKAKEADCPIVGGHTIRDKEPKYGLAVIGMVHPDKILYKGKLDPGDKIVLTKPLGFGLVTTSNKSGKADPEDFSKVVAWMKTLNKKASELAQEFGLKSGTDITGFSLIGHSCEMIRKGNIGLRYEWDRIPFVDHYEKYMNMGLFPGGAVENLKFYEKNVHFSSRINELEQMMLFDPQTSGGLLLGVKPELLPAFLRRAESIGQKVWVIGEAIEGSGIEVL
ncbi:selenide, water dikinase SelD [Flexilinea flocculi]|uniref:Selenide, water dikinase n=1 Tax=Flexilinea flocculi TaxID=1678840 RepID=A0A0S7BJN2_9CHLR|nr:selenide, water dikinase SelD [Flexilinea flocculi]GAP40490.1 selenophosphate synthase [Flexilinea flocculi]